MFHATPLRKDVSGQNPGVYISSHGAGIWKAEAVEAELNAIVEDGLPEDDETRPLHIDIGAVFIAIVSVSQMPDVAAQTAREMR